MTIAPRRIAELREWIQTHAKEGWMFQATAVDLLAILDELARYRPLIKAVEKARKSTLTDDRVFWGVDEDAILRAALKCRGGKMSQWVYDWWMYFQGVYR